jgi:hypothetical protein
LYRAFFSNKGKYLTLWLFLLLFFPPPEAKYLQGPRRFFPKDSESVDHRLAFHAMSGNQSDFREEKPLCTGFSDDIASSLNLMGLQLIFWLTHEISSGAQMPSLGTQDKR